MWIEINNPYPEDYIQQMDIFSAVELRRFQECRLHYRHPEKKIFRDMLIKKRSEFDYYKWMKKSAPKKRG